MWSPFKIRNSSAPFKSFYGRLDCDYVISHGKQVAVEKVITKYNMGARMSFKPAKSRSLVLKKGKVMERVSFTIAGEKSLP